MHTTLRNKFLVGFGLIWLVTALISFFAFLVVTRLTEQVRLSLHTQAVKENLDLLQTDLTKAEINLSHYVHSGDPIFLDGFNAAGPNVANTLNRLNTLKDPSHTNQPQINQLEAQIAVYLQTLNAIRRTRTSDGEEAAYSQLISEEILHLQADILQSIEQIKQNETDAYRQQAERLQQTLRSAGVTSGIAILLALTVAVLSGISLSHRINRSTSALVHGTERFAAGQLDYRVPVTSHDEIAILSKAFNQMAAQLQETLTERNRANEALQQANAELEQRVQTRTLDLARSEKEYRDLADHALVGIFRIRTNGEQLYLNEAMAHILEHPTVAEAMQPASGDSSRNASVWQKIIAALPKTGILMNHELDILTQRGNQRTVLVNLRVEGDVCSGMVMDITEQKRVTEEKVWLARLPQENPNPILRISAEGHLAYHNPAATPLLESWNWTEGAQVPESWRQIVQTALTNRQEETLECHVQAHTYSMLVVPIAEASYVNVYGTNITARIQAETQMRTYSQRIYSLAEASRVFTEATLDYEILLERITQYMADAFGDLCILRLFPQDSAWDDRVIFHDADNDVQENIRKLLSNFFPGRPLGFVGSESVSNDEPQLFPQFKPEALQPYVGPAYWPMFESLPIHSMIITPLSYRKRVIGLLFFIRHQEASPAYTWEDLTLARDLGERASLSITNARLFDLVQKELYEKAYTEEKIRQLNAHLEHRVTHRTEELQTALKKTETLYAIARTAVASENLSTSLEEVVAQVATALPAHRVVLLTIDMAQKQVTHLVRGGPGKAEHTPNLTFEDWMDGLTGWVMREGKATLSPKDHADPRESIPVQLRRVRTHAGALAIAPLRFLGQTLGTLTAIQHSDSDNYTNADLALLEAIADQTAALLVREKLNEGLRQTNLGLQAEIAEREQLEIQIRKTALRAKALADLSQTLAESRLDHDSLFEMIVHRVAEWIGDTCNLSLLSEDGQWLKTQAFYHPDPEGLAFAKSLIDTFPYRVGKGLAGQVAQTGQAILIPFIPPEKIRQHFKPEFIPYLDRFGVASVLIVPLRVQDRIIGTLGVSRDQPGNPYTLEDQSFLQDLADRAGLAIENSRLLSDALAAREEADQANLAKSEFLSRMSHELRTPLNAILGFSQILAMDELNNAQSNAIQHILHAGKHLLGLINEVLDITRIEVGKLSLSPEPIRIKGVIEEALELVQALADQYDVQIAPPHCPTEYVYADHQRLKQVFLNLLTNAIKYNRKGGQVLIQCVHHTNEKLRINIRDTGEGIPPDMLKRLFIPFERLGAEKTNVEGTGLGLSLSHRLVEAMGGSLGVESEMGVGSTFWIELALAENPMEKTYHPEDGLIQFQANPEYEQNYTVLCIEDNLSNLQLIEQIFKHRPSIKLLAASNGRTGLESALTHLPNLILLDINLPDLAGTELFQQLKHHPQTNHIPIVIVSADATSGQIKNLLDRGAYQYLTKPLDIPLFLQVVDEILHLNNAPSSDKPPDN